MNTPSNKPPAQHLYDTYITLQQHLVELASLTHHIIHTYYTPAQCTYSTKFCERTCHGNPEQCTYMYPHLYKFLEPFSQPSIDTITTTIDTTNNDNATDIIDALHNNTKWKSMRSATPHLKHRFETALTHYCNSLNKDTYRAQIKTLVETTQFPANTDKNSDPKLTEIICTNLSLPHIENNHADENMYHKSPRKALSEIFGCTDKYARDILTGREDLTTETKHTVDQRDDNRCVKCESPHKNLVYHHITLAKNGGKSTVENIALLCNECHRETHGDSWRTTIYDSKNEFWDWTNQ